MRWMPVSRRAYRQMFTMPEWPHPVRITRPLSATWTTRAWSSRMSGSASQAPWRYAWWIGKPVSKAVFLSTSPVTRTEPSNRKRAGVFADLEAGVGEGRPAGGGQVHGFAPGDHEAPAAPELRVNNHRQRGAAQSRHES